MRTHTAGYCLTLLTLVAVLAVHSSAASISPDSFTTQTSGVSSSPQPDCEALTRGPLPAWPDSVESSKRLTDCGYSISGKGDYRRAEVVFEAALEMATRRGDRASRAVALAGLGRTLGTLGRAERAEPMLLESLQISEALDDKDGMAEAASQLGVRPATVG